MRINAPTQLVECEHERTIKERRSHVQRIELRLDLECLEVCEELRVLLLQENVLDLLALDHDRRRDGFIRCIGKVGLALRPSFARALVS